MAAIGLVLFICCWILLAYGGVTQQRLLMALAYVNAIAVGVVLLVFG